MMCREAACVPFCPRGFSSWSVLLRQSPHPPPALCLLEKLNPLPPCILHFTTVFHFGFSLNSPAFFECAANNALFGRQRGQSLPP
jgi:hypothetical protein